MVTTVMATNPLKAFREAQTPPLSQGELAKKLGVTRATVSRWESGERFPERDLWPVIHQITGVSADDLARSAA